MLQGGGWMQLQYRQGGKVTKVTMGGHLGGSSLRILAPGEQFCELAQVRYTHLRCGSR
jgi:hypothetical protein